jgi:LAO/AO transport system kinase
MSVPGNPDAPELIPAILRGDLRQAAKLITRIERGDPVPDEVLRSLYRAGGKSQIIGITGAPGSGKSTLVDQLLTSYRRAGKRIAVLAVDPSSPLSGGAILGDRVRMRRHATDEGVFIRSMSSRGALGGLAKATADALTVLDAMGWDIVLIETVGVGQNEIDIVRYAATVVLVETPSTGDAVQSVKAGVTEIGDIFIVNKADQSGADRRVQDISAMLHNAPAKGGWFPPVHKVDSISGNGIENLISCIDAHMQFLMNHSQARKDRLLQSVKHQILWIMQERLARRVLRAPQPVISETELDELLARRTDPYQLAQSMAVGHEL